MSRTKSTQWHLHLAEEFGHEDITPQVEAFVKEAGITTGMVTVALVGSTGGVTTIEYESGALADLRRAFDHIAPADGDYEHNARWGDGNGYSHVRSALLKTSLCVAVVDAKVQLGTWQQVVVINFDNRARDRTVVATVVGE